MLDKTFVAVAPDSPATVLGYYTISPGAIALAKAPSVVTRRLGRYEVPVFRWGRLANLRPAPAETLALICSKGVALAIDARDDRAAVWYERFGALQLVDDPLRLTLPLDTLRFALQQQQ